MNMEYCNLKLMSQDNNSHQEDQDYQSEDILQKELSINTSEVDSVQDKQLSSKDQTLSNHIHQQLQQSLPVSATKFNQNIDMSTDIAQFKQYGPTYYLLLVFIKKAIILFSFLTVINLILIFYNFAVGQTFPVKATGIGIAFARASLGSFSAGSQNQSRTKLLYQTITSINIVALFCFWLYWRAFSSREAQKIQRRMELSNFCTVVVQGKGIEQANQNEAEEFMQQFGTVKEVVRVIDRGQEIQIATQIATLEQQITHITSKYQNVDNIPKKLSQRLIKKYQQVEKLTQILKKQVIKNRRNKNIRFFVKLDSRLNQKNAIQKLKRQKCCCLQEPSLYVLKGQEVTVSRCEAQCWGIYWQNQSVGFKHNIIPNIILLLLVNLIPMVSIIIIGLISVTAEPVYYQPSLATNQYSETQILAQTNRTITASWCIGNHYSSNMQSTCSPFMQSLNDRVGIYFAIALCTTISQLGMKVTIMWFSKYFRFKDHAQKSNTIMLHLFLNYAVVYIVIPLAAQANLFKTAMSDVMAQFITIEPAHSRLTQLRQYYDYVPQWYADYGFQLILNYCLIIIFPYSILPLAHFIFNKIKLLFSYSKKGEVQEKRVGESQQFQLEDRFANVFMSIIAGMAFAGGMPILFPLMLLSLVVRYFSIKYLFIYTSKFPKLTDRLITTKMPHILFVIIIVYIANTVWALGVQQIFTPYSKLFEALGITSDSNARTISEVLLVFFRRLFNNWPILLVLCLGLMVVLMRKRLSNTWYRILIVLRLGQRSSNEGENNMQMHQIEDYLQLDKSYDPLNNNHYRPIFQKLKN